MQRTIDVLLGIAAVLLFAVAVLLLGILADLAHQ